MSHKIITPAHIESSSFEYRGYTFRHYDGKPFGSKQIWVATKEMTVEKLNDGIIAFKTELVEILNKLSVITQTGFNALGQTFFAYREYHGKPAMYVYHTKPMVTVGMSFHQDEIKYLENLEKIENPAALFYLQQANNATSSYVLLTMLLMGAEGLAGYTEHGNNYFKTDHEKLKAMLGSEIYGKLYGDDQIRNQLMHGKPVDDRLVSGIVEKVYNSIREYINVMYGLAVPQITNAPRGTTGHYEVMIHFFYFNGKPILDLRPLEELLEPLWGSAPYNEIDIDHQPMPADF